MHLHRCTETSSVGRMALQSNKADVTFAYIPRTYRMNRRFYCIDVSSKSETIRKEDDFLMS